LLDFDANFHRNFVGFDLHEPGYFNIHNSTAGNISLTKAVVFSGGVAGDNNLKNIELLSDLTQLIVGVTVAQYQGANNAIDIVGPIADGNDGIVCGMGTIFNVDTSSLTEGADVFTDASGNLTSSTTIRKIGFCIISNAITGQLFIDVVGEKGDKGDPGTGDVVGPAVAVDNNFAAFDTTTGKLIKDSGIPVNFFGTEYQSVTNTTFRSTKTKDRPWARTPKP